MRPNLITSIQKSIHAIQSLQNIASEVEEALSLLLAGVEKGRKILWIGNGGSAAEAQHFAAELMVRLDRKRAPIASIALTTDSSVITAHSNDFTYETVFARQVEALAQEGDIVVGLSTSGNSENIELAFIAAQKKKALTIGILGRDGGKIKSHCTVSLIPESDSTANIQEAHLVIGHYLCDCLEQYVSTKK